MKKVFLILSYLFWAGILCAQQQQSQITGKVISQADRLPLPGVNVIVKGTVNGTVTNEEGEFTLTVPNGLQVLRFSYIGYTSQELETRIPLSAPLTVSLLEDQVTLSQFDVVSTGFQELSAERTTGSFARLDTELINRSVSTDIVQRIRDVTPGLIVLQDNFSIGAEPQISIRGTSTIQAENQPLIVVDNLAYDGPISSINPNDVESITVLRDAAAASIWGARAGNGVIVITTKKGKLNEPVRVSFNANATWGQEPDPFYQPQMAINGFVDLEVNLFKKGVYNGDFNSFMKTRLSPVVETLFRHRNGLLSDAELNSALSGFRAGDVRNDLRAYFGRPSLNQQYALGFSGGSERYTYNFSTGWDDNKSNRVTEGNSRFTFSSNQNLKLLNNRLQVGIGTYLALSQNQTALPDINNFFPYERLADEEGNPLSVYRSYNERFKEEVRKTNLLNWDYFPLDEIGLSPSRNQANDLRLNANLGYKILPDLSFSTFYQYWTNSTSGRRLQPLEAYATRELINNFSEINAAGQVINNLPMGGILDQNNLNSHSHTVRSQLSWQKNLGKNQVLNLLGGVELKDQQGNGTTKRFYGYNETIGLSLPVNYTTFFRQYALGFTSSIPFADNFTGTVNRYLSGFLNMGYTLKNRYLVNASARVDKSNLFGVKTNQKSVPLWSVGLGWIATEEEFWEADWVTFLKLRTSYGYNGNTNTRATALTTGNYFGAGSNALVGFPFLGIVTPPNPELRWERIKIINTGVDFELWKGKWFGSVDVYQKQGLDLLGQLSVFPSSGFNSAVLNYASTSTRGVDVNLNFKTKLGAVLWTSSFFYSGVKEKVTEIQNNPTTAQIMANQAGAEVPLLGKPLHHVHSYPWAGLNPDTGAPRGILDGEPSENYSRLIQLSEDQLIYHGSSRPTGFGALRNQLDWKGWNLSFNISYRMGYYFRDQSVDYDNINRGIISHADYDRRWQNPGDRTSIPADPGRVDSPRNMFYLRSSALVQRGDHIRLQDIRVAYTFSNPKFRDFQIYSYVNNLGILWKASDRVQDPDFRFTPALRAVAFGLTMSF
ncbi:TonB-linked SusC/RagA family outer membrane protein [Algoriphagus aquaeductus]|uniref:TonB-linked SusC/RagA family outer membrane protein n=1 Tax=Algoriphagus aquaeductus TaxID=475299 RepID=A0A326RQJ9_9BACT|nr:SusC/RagA family TonB-linked outer membrane protein [Algoriphagus aquaeductus]PZV82293.1 TonB-linked SusC/RagA family outer membrane protein [Algoriphagus aquaeductus]